MTVHIEWLHAAETSATVLSPGEQWVGEGMHRRPVLTLADDAVVAIEGTPAQLLELSARIADAVTQSQPRRTRRRPLTPRRI